MSVLTATPSGANGNGHVCATRSDRWVGHGAHLVDVVHGDEGVAVLREDGVRPEVCGRRFAEGPTTPTPRTVGETPDRAM